MKKIDKGAWGRRLENTTGEGEVGMWEVRMNECWVTRKNTKGEGGGEEDE